MRSKIILATRSSKLALVQANLVKSEIEKHSKGLQVELLPIKTSGDLILDRPLREVGGKTLFVKEIEEALLQQKADLAVHSLKDVPSLLPNGLKIGAILKREDPRDILVFSNGVQTCLSWKSLKQRAVIGTSSLRRKVQLLRLRSDLNIEDLRGNVDTRLKKLKEKEFDGIVLAFAGVHRLNLKLDHFEFLPIIPASGQGAIGIEIREGEKDLEELLQPLHHPQTAICVNAERIISEKLEGECELPIGAYGEIMKSHFYLNAFIATPKGDRFIEGTVSGDPSLSESLAEELASTLFAKGAKEIVEEIKKTSPLRPSP